MITENDIQFFEDLENSDHFNMMYFYKNYKNAVTYQIKCYQLEEEDEEMLDLIKERFGDRLTDLRPAHEGFKFTVWDVAPQK